MHSANFTAFSRLVAVLLLAAVLLSPSVPPFEQAAKSSGAMASAAIDLRFILIPPHLLW
jgi:hypothetical protein